MLLAQTNTDISAASSKPLSFVTPPTSLWMWLLLVKMLLWMCWLSWYQRLDTRERWVWVLSHHLELGPLLTSLWAAQSGCISRMKEEQLRSQRPCHHYSGPGRETTHWGDPDRLIIKLCKDTLRHSTGPTGWDLLYHLGIYCNFHRSINKIKSAPEVEFVKAVWNQWEDWCDYQILFYHWVCSCSQQVYLSLVQPSVIFAVICWVNQYI